jgi:hypothetical protein
VQDDRIRRSIECLVIDTIQTVTAEQAADCCYCGVLRFRYIFVFHRARNSHLLPPGHPFKRYAIPFLYPYYREILGLDDAAVYQAQYNLTRNCQATINFGGILLLTFCLSVVVAIVLQL